MKGSKELKNLSRSELLELLLIQTKETERLREQLAKTQEQLAEKNLHIANAGDLAHAVLQINGVMEAAQAAARQYLDNMAAMEAETKRKCERILAEAKSEARRIRGAGEDRETDAFLADCNRLLNG